VERKPRLPFVLRLVAHRRGNGFARGWDSRRGAILAQGFVCFALGWIDQLLCRVADAACCFGALASSLFDDPHAHNCLQ